MLIIYNSKAQWLTSQVDESEADVVAYFEGYLIKVVRNEINGRVGDFCISDFASEILCNAMK